MLSNESKVTVVNPKAVIFYYRGEFYSNELDNNESRLVFFKLKKLGGISTTLHYRVYLGRGE